MEKSIKDFQLKTWKISAKLFMMRQHFHCSFTRPLLLWGFIMGKLKLVPVVSSTVSYERGLFQAVTLIFDSRLNGCLWWIIFLQSRGLNVQLQFPISDLGCLMVILWHEDSWPAIHSRFDVYWFSLNIKHKLVLLIIDIVSTTNHLVFIGPHSEGET